MPPDILTPEPPSQDVLKRWLERHLELLEAERTEEQNQSRLLLSKTAPKVLERAGLALLNLSVSSVRIGLGAKLLVELERPSAYHSSPSFPSHTFRPGDLAALLDANADPSKGGEGVQGVVFRVTDTKIVVAVQDDKKGRTIKEVGERKRDAKTGEASKIGGNELELPERVRIVKVANEGTFDRMEQNLLKLGRHLGLDIKSTSSRRDDSDSESETVSSAGSGSASPLIRSLLGLTPPIWNALQDLPLPPFNPKLNETQLSSIRFALASQHFSLIHGPPGTGKTTTIVELILQIVMSNAGASNPAQGVKVLVCGASNLAVDNILERLVGKAEQRDALKKKGAGVTRLGHPARVMSSLHPATLDAQSTASSEGQLVLDISKEINAHMQELKPAPPAGNKSTKSVPRLKGSERKKKWEEVRELRKEYRRRERQVVTSVLDKAQIVLATCHGAGGRQLNNREFDWVIIDEACQALEAACWIPILKAKETGRVVLGGDHLQLPPTVKSNTGLSRPVQPKKPAQKSSAASATSNGAAKEPTDADPLKEKSTGEAEEEEQDTGLAESFTKVSLKDRPRPKLRPPRSLESTQFSRLLGLYGAGVKSLLSIQYRMNESIMSFPNTELYESKLSAHESCSDIRLSDLSNVRSSEEEEELLAPVVFYNTEGCEYYEASPEGDALLADSKSNIHELELVLQHLTLLFKHGVTADQVTILTPYSAQVSLLSTTLRETQFDGPDGKLLGETIELGTVDSMQGREKDVVIVSLVRSNDRREVGFLAQKKRLNVAMTRARRQLVVIGDSDTVAQAKDLPDEFLPHWLDWLDANAVVESVVATLG